MAGWNLTEGICTNINPIDQEFWGALDHLYSSTHKTTTYKFCFMKCLLDCIPFDNDLNLSFDALFYRFTEIYWDLIVKYGLSQVYKNSKYHKSKVESIIEKVIHDHNIKKQDNINSLPHSIKKNMIKEITYYCSQNVVGAFFESTYGLFYSFSKKDKVITLTQNSKSFFYRYRRVIEVINYFNWAKMIEKVNGNKTPSSLITKMSKLGRGMPSSPTYYTSEESEKFNLEDILPWSF